MNCIWWNVRPHLEPSAMNQGSSHIHQQKRCWFLIESWCWAWVLMQEERTQSKVLPAFWSSTSNQLREEVYLNSSTGLLWAGGLDGNWVLRPDGWPPFKVFEFCWTTVDIWGQPMYIWPLLLSFLPGVRRYKLDVNNNNIKYKYQY